MPPPPQQHPGHVHPGHVYPGHVQPGGSYHRQHSGSGLQRQSSAVALQQMNASEAERFQLLRELFPSVQPEVVRTVQRGTSDEVQQVQMLQQMADEHDKSVRRTQPGVPQGQYGGPQGAILPDGRMLPYAQVAHPLGVGQPAPATRPPQQTLFIPGDKVSAQFQGAWYPATITQAHPDHEEEGEPAQTWYDVTWVEDNSLTLVRETDLRKRDDGPVPTAPPPEDPLPPPPPAAGAGPATVPSAAAGGGSAVAPPISPT